MGDTLQSGVLKRLSLLLCVRVVLVPPCRMMMGLEIPMQVRCEGVGWRAVVLALGWGRWTELTDFLLLHFFRHPPEVMVMMLPLSQWCCGGVGREDVGAQHVVFLLHVLGLGEFPHHGPHHGPGLGVLK
jgi:hypothetical protein